MKKSYLILMAGLVSGLAVNRAAAQDEAVEPIEIVDHCLDMDGGIGIGIIPVLPEDGEVTITGEEATSGEAEEVKREVAPEEVSEVKGLPVEVDAGGETVCPEIYYMSAGGPLPEQRGEAASGDAETGADRDEAEEAPAPKFAKKSITDIVKKSSKPTALVKKGRVFLRR